MSETKRTVETQFTAKDAGFSSAVGRISNAFEGGVHKLNHFREKVGEFRRETGLTTLAALGLGYGIGSWIEKTKEANAEFEGTKKGIAGILAGSLKFASGTSEIDRYNRSLVLSKEITQQLDETSARFVQPLDSVATAYRGIMTAAGGLGLTQKQVMNLTEESVATAKRFGVSGEQAATAISRALQTGAVRGFDPFDTKLRQTLGNMKKLTQAQRFEHIEKALKGSMDIADAMSSGIGGALAQARNVVDDLIRDATGPLFKEIAGSLSKWSKHLREAKEQGKPIVEMFGDKLVAGFKVLQSLSGFIKDHWMAIGAVFASIKAKDLAERLGASLSGIGASLGGSAGSLAGGIGGALGGLAGKILPVVGALATFKVALDGLTDFISERIAKSMNDEAKAHGVAGTFGITKKLADLGVLSEGQAKIARQQVENLRKGGIVNGSGTIDRSALADALGKMTLEKREGLAKDMEMRHPWLPQSQIAGQVDFMADQLAKKFGGLISQFASPAKALADDKTLKFAKQINNFNGGIHITQKFEDQDPDRVFVRFKSDLEREVSSKTQALTAEPQGD